MQDRKPHVGDRILEEAKNLPNQNTANYKNLVVASTILAVDGLAAALLPSSALFWLLEVEALAAAGVAACQMGGVGTALQSGYRFFAGAPVAKKPDVAAAADATASAAVATPAAVATNPVPVVDITAPPTKRM